MNIKAIIAEIVSDYTDVMQESMEAAVRENAPNRTLVGEALKSICETVRDDLCARFGFEPLFAANLTRGMWATAARRSDMFKAPSQRDLDELFAFGRSLV